MFNLTYTNSDKSRKWSEQMSECTEIETFKQIFFMEKQLRL